MATAAPEKMAPEKTAIETIGDVSGVVWHTLNENGPLSMSKLVKFADAPRDVVMQAIGWLAREDKLHIEDTSRGRVVALR